MSTTIDQRKTGAPVRVLVLIFGCWFVGRTIWLVFPAQSELEAIAAIQSRSTDHATQVRMKKTTADSVRLSQLANNELDIMANGRTYCSRYAVTDIGIEGFPRFQFGGEIKKPNLARDDVMMSHSIMQDPQVHNLEKDQQIIESVNAFSFRIDAGDDVMKLGAEYPESGLSGYFWLFMRQNGSSDPSTRPLLGPAPVIYGGTQAGAILSYRVAGNPKSSISLFTRFSTAKAAGRWATDQEQLAAGLKAKPFTSIPITVHAEQRLDVESGGNEGAAFYLSGGTGPAPLVAGVELETYAQAGIVLARRDQFFFDGSATLQNQIIRKDRKSVSIGAGIWAGGQSDVRRIDVGPRVEFKLPIGKKHSARISLDWRQKISGNASPDDGVAVSVSSGF